MSDPQIDNLKPLVDLITLTDEELLNLHGQFLTEYRKAVENASVSNSIDVIQNHPALLMMHEIKKIQESRETIKSLTEKISILKDRIEEGKRFSGILYEIVGLLRVLQSNLPLDLREEIMEILGKLQTEEKEALDARSEVYRVLSGDYSQKPFIEA